ncbi:MAG: DUF167 domain-containing protein [Anaerolineales bacterium]
MDEDFNNTKLKIRVTPRAKRDEVYTILEDGTVKVRLTAPPVEGKANKALIKYFSGIFEIPRSQIEILSGFKSRNKRVSIQGMGSVEIYDKLNEIVKRPDQ